MQPGRILLVEDNPDHEELALLALKRSNVHDPVQVVHDGAEALEFLHCTGRYETRQPGGEPLVVLLDLKLPGLDGMEVLRRMRADRRTQFMPVVVLTSSDEEGDIRTCYALGANSYVCKPVDFVHFVEAIRQIRTYWLHLNQVPSGR